MSQTKPQTLESLIESRRELDRPVAVHVADGPTTESTIGREVVEKVADMLGENIVELGDVPGSSDLSGTDVVVITLGPDRWDDGELWTNLRHLQSVARVRELDIVVHSKEVPKAVTAHLTARIVVDGKLIHRVERIEVDNFGHDVYGVEIDSRLGSKKTNKEESNGGV